MPRAARHRRAGFPTARILLVMTLTLAPAVPARAALPPPSTRLPAMFGRPAWHADHTVPPMPPWMRLVRSEETLDAR